MLSEIQLHEGIYTQKALAEWVGVNISTLKRNKEKYLEELKEYAGYDLTESGKINIKYIKIPVYVKKNSNYQKVKKVVPKYWSENKIDKKKWVATKIQEKELMNIGESTTYSYVCRATTELWGKPNGASGPAGYNYWVLCVRTSSNTLRPFTEEEQGVRKKYKAKYFQKKQEALSKQEEKREVVELMRQSGKLTKEEYKEEMYNLDEPLRVAYDEYLKAMQSILQEGEILDYGIYVEQSAYCAVSG